MRLGIITTWFERGAAYVSRLYRDSLTNSGCKVFIYARGGERYATDDPMWDDGSIFWAKRTNLPWETAIDKNDFKSWIQKNRIEVVIFNEQRWWPPVWWCKQWKIKTAAYIDYYTEETVPFFRIYDLLLCNTRRHYSVFKWHPQCEYLSWGTNTNLFVPKRLDSVGENGPIFFHSAGMSPFRKGTDLVLKAFSKLQGQSHLIVHSQVNLTKTLPPDVVGLMKDLHSKGLLEIKETDVHAPGLYHLGDVYVYPSRLEGIGLTMTEALACGLPIIVPDWPPMNEFLTQDAGKGVAIEKVWSRADGYYWPQCQVDLSELTNAMQSYINHFNKIIYFRKIARKQAKKLFNWEKNSSQLKKLIEQSEILPVDPKIYEDIKIFYKKNYNYRQFVYHKNRFIFSFLVSAEKRYIQLFKGVK